ncbi:MAG: polysaccharide deacetylase family protein [Opitutaceae bacterium]|nr:polysaccharide deacetylase family protein [Opitutaceae bacterium]
MRRSLLLGSILGIVAGIVLWRAGIHPIWVGAVLVVTGLPLAWALLVPGAQGLGPVVTRFETERREVWLTIDDGPDPEDTPRVLEVLARHRAHATFFVVGERADRHLPLIQEIVHRGHEVAHHTHTHPEATFWCARSGRVERELDDTLAVLSPIGVVPRWFRAPVGIKNVFLWTATAARGMRVVGWTVRSWDSVARDPEAVAKLVLRRVRPGSILLFHEGPRLRPAVRVAALDRTLKALTDAGYACVLPDPASLR